MPVYVISAFNSKHTSLLASNRTRHMNIVLIIWLSEKDLHLLPVFKLSVYCALGKGAVRKERLNPLAW
jgi:hypothetical protein